MNEDIMCGEGRRKSYWPYVDGGGSEKGRKIHVSMYS